MQKSDCLTKLILKFLIAKFQVNNKYSLEVQPLERVTQTPYPSRESIDNCLCLNAK